MHREYEAATTGCSKRLPQKIASPIISSYVNKHPRVLISKVMVFSIRHLALLKRGIHYA